jgi:hypothetical protein
MLLTLRDQILVVLDYEDPQHAEELIERLALYRESIGKRNDLKKERLRRVLYQMVEYEDLLEPWVRVIARRKNRRFFKWVRVGELNCDPNFFDHYREPLLLHYRLTPKGWQRQRDIFNALVRRSAWYPKKGGRS